MPLLALGGEFSFGEFAGQMWQAFAANVEAGVIPQAAHFILEEQPALVSERLLAFFA